MRMQKKRKEFWEVIKKIKNENKKIGTDDKKMERGYEKNKRFDAITFEECFYCVKKIYGGEKRRQEKMKIIN